MAKGYCDKDCKQVTEGQSRGDQYQCGVCGRYTKKVNDLGTEKFVDNGYSAEYVVSSEKRITSVEEVEALCKFDKSIWQIDRWQQEAGVSEGYRKDRKVEWEVEDGKVTHGKVEDSNQFSFSSPLDTMIIKYNKANCKQSTQSLMKILY